MFLIDCFLVLRGEAADLYRYIIGYKYRKSFDEYKKRKKVFFLMTPSYGNLGDQAIEVATTKCLEKHFQEYTIIKIHLQDTGKYLRAVKRTLGKDDIIVLQGGGNFGDLYPSCERARRRIVKAIKHKYIISMPSSIHYLNTLKGRIELARSRRIYNKKNFICISRDHFSYEFAKNKFSNCINLLSPDIVLYLQEKRTEKNRTSVLLCVRTDKESAIGNEREHIVDLLFKKYDEAIITDTQLYRDISDVNKKNEVESILRVFRNAKIVVTDRLHGLVFSAITNTPCVVIESKDKKIEGVYEWLKNNQNIVFCPASQISTIEEIVDKLLCCSTKNEFNLTEQIDDIMHEVVELIEKKEDI